MGSLAHGAAALADGFVDLLLPAVCGACGRADELEDGLCRACRLELLSLIAVTEPAQVHPSPGEWAVARYVGTDKHVVTEAAAYKIDLATDPDELSPVKEAASPEDEALLEALRARHEGEAPPTAMDAELLRSLGYME